MEMDEFLAKVQNPNAHFNYLWACLKHPNGESASCYWPLSVAGGAYSWDIENSDEDSDSLDFINGIAMPGHAWTIVTWWS